MILRNQENKQDVRINTIEESGQLPFFLHKALKKHHFNGINNKNHELFNHSPLIQTSCYKNHEPYGRTIWLKHLF
jgi:uncharacterized membrane protein YcaP (DUF421 family)